MPVIRGKKELREKRLEVLKWLAEQAGPLPWLAVRERFNLPWKKGAKTDECSRIVKHHWFICRNGTVWASEAGFLQLRGIESPPWRHPEWDKTPEQKAEVERRRTVAKKKRDGEPLLVLQKLLRPEMNKGGPRDQNGLQEREARIEAHRKRIEQGK